MKPLRFLPFTTQTISEFTPSLPLRSFRASSRLLQIIVCLALAILTCSTCRATTYYVNCANSGDGSGTSSNPWNSLSSVNAHNFSPGDTILFYTPATCTGNFTANGSGTSAAPITVNQYGPGPGRPVIAGAGQTDTITLSNVQYWSINNLEVTNRSQDWPNPHRGVDIVANDFGTMSGISIIGCYIHDVYGNDAKDQDGSSGIQLSVDGTTKPTKLDAITIKNNVIENIWRQGIGTGSSWLGDRPTSYLTAWPTGWTNVLIQGNLLQNIAGDGIDAEHLQSPVIQYNVLRGAGHYISGASAGIWAWDSNNALFQYNETADLSGAGDAYGYDEDYNQDHTIYQYNYSHNNFGGFLLSCEHCGSPGGTNSIVRYNISVDDGPLLGTCSSTGFGCQDMGGLSNYANTYVKTAATIATFSNGGRLSGFNNILYEGKPTTDNVYCAYGPCHHNLLYNVTDGGETGDVSADPQFFLSTNVPSGIGNLRGLELNVGSPGIGAGAMAPSDGTTQQDFFGNAISSSSALNMGAYNGPGGSTLNLLENPGLESGSLGPWWGAWNNVATTVIAPRNGRYALLIGPGQSSSEQQVSGLTPNTTYTFGGYAAVMGSGQTVNIGAKNYDSSGNQTYQALGSTSYTPGFATFTTGPSNTTATVYFWEPSGSGTATGDDFFLQKNLLANPGIEEGVLGAWGRWNNVSTTTSSVHSGSYALQVGTAPSSSEQYLSELQPNTNYVYGGWARLSSTDGETAYLGVKSYDSTGNQQLQRVSSTSWSYVQIPFTTSPENTTATAFCYNASGGQTIYCDDMAINPNLLDNPGFESGASGMPVGPFATAYGPTVMGAWIPTGIPSGGTAIAFENSNVRTGSMAAQLNGSSSTIYQTVCGLYPNKQYTFAGWGMASSPGNAMQLFVSEYDGNATASSTSVANTSYSPAYVSFVTGSTSTCAKLTVSQTSGSGAVYIDDMSLSVSGTQ